MKKIIIFFLFIYCLGYIMSKEIIKLPDPNYNSNTSIEESLLKRRSIREYKNSPLSLKDVSQVLWACQGITKKGFYRTTPSAGALYPLEIYIVIGNVENVTQGIYKYEPLKHQIISVITEDKRKNLFDAALGQSPIRNAPIIIVITAIFNRTTGKYGNRGIRYVFMEAGHAAQNVYLQSVSLNLGTVVIGAFNDEAIKKILNLSRDEEPLYLMPVGKM